MKIMLLFLFLLVVNQVYLAWLVVMVEKHVRQSTFLPPTCVGMKCSLPAFFLAAFAASGFLLAFLGDQMASSSSFNKLSPQNIPTRIAKTFVGLQCRRVQIKTNKGNSLTTQNCNH
jgi:hypothetical protein